MKTEWRKCNNQLTDPEELKNKYTETNNTITEVKNTLEGITSRIYEAEEQISEWAGRNNGGNNFWRAE